MLCLDCLEARLGRPLTDDDFKLFPCEIYRNLFRPPDLTAEEREELERIEQEKDAEAEMPSHRRS